MSCNTFYFRRSVSPSTSLTLNPKPYTASHACISRASVPFPVSQGFTPMCKVLEPRVVMAFLNDLFTGFDRRLDEFGVYKVCLEGRIGRLVCVRGVRAARK